MNSQLVFVPPDSNTEFILAFLLSAEFPGAAELKTQLSGLPVGVIDDEGSLRLRVCSGVPAQIADSVPVEASYSDSPIPVEKLSGPLVHILLHVRDGLLHELEWYKDDGSPIGHKPAHEELVIDVLPFVW